MTDHAVVLGGSIAGSLAARVLADTCEQVTVVDRDVLCEGVHPRQAVPRQAVPQGHHIHALLARGQQILDELFPGFTSELVDRGVPVGDFGTTLSWYFNGEMIRKAHTGLVCVAAGRPLLEAYLRGRVRSLPNVAFRDCTDIRGLAASADRSRITGVRVQGRDPSAAEEVLDADLVVDTTGRGSRTPRWLEELGYGRVQEERVAMDLTYTTCDYQSPLPFDPIGENIAIIPVATPALPRGAIFARMPDRYSISLTGILGDQPPTDHRGFLDYVRSLPVPEIYQAARQAEPLGTPVRFRFPASIRRHYERLPRLPGGLLAMGDAACVFNPVYAQGMTVAALETLVLARHLAHDPPQPARYFRDLARVIDAPWDMSAGADLGFKGTRGRRTLKVRLGNAYIPRLQAAAVTDDCLSAAFLRAAGLVDPPTALLRPSVVARVLMTKGRWKRL
ncbi:MAG TPA: FAD-binding monooxygenase [Streptosporangiaceae bacterium]|nr:FAD-binding monooxygenase [Streptosporangiaceae bacterium]